jgi:TRAP-type C4-dicarboxylate transport system permease small subunit
VKFTLTYDKATPRGKAIIRIVGNGAIALLLAVSFPATLDYIQFLEYQKSTVLRIPFNIAYGPYLVFLVLTTAHCVYDIVLDAKKLVRGELSS